MAISIFQSGGSARFTNIPRAAQPAAALNIANTAEAFNAQRILSSAGKLTKAFVAVKKERDEIKQATDLLDESNKYFDATQEFERGYQDTHRGVDAVDTTKDLEQFHAEQLNERSKRFAGNPRQELMWQKQAAQTRRGSLNRGQSFEVQQDKIYRDDTTKATTSKFLQQTAMNSYSDTTIQNLSKIHRDTVKALNPGRDLTAYFAETDLDMAVTRIRTVLAENKPGAAAEAKRLTNSYREVLGTSYDDISKQVRSAEVNQTSYDNSEDIRRDMPATATLDEKLDRSKELAGADIEVDKATRSMITYAHNAEKRVAAERNNAIQDTFDGQILAIKNPQDMDKVLANIGATPMENKTRRILSTRARNAVKIPKLTDADKYKQAQVRVAAEDITEAELIREFQFDLTSGDLNELKTRLKDTGGARITRYELDLENRLRKRYPNKAGVHKTARKSFSVGMDQWVKEYRATNGKQPSNKELRDQENFISEQVIYNENAFWFDDKTERFRIGTVATGDLEVAEVDNELIKRGWRVGMPGYQEARDIAYTAYFKKGKN